MVIGLLFLTGCVVLVGLLTVQGSRNAGRVAQFLGVMLATPMLATTLVAWRQRVTTTSQPTAGQLDEARETLAGVITKQWLQEARARSLEDPEPMPVCWRLTEPAVMDHPRLIAIGELSFTGRSDQIGPLAAEFRRLRRRRLVILGGPGTGKTTLAVQLLLELLRTRKPGEPIPVLVSLAGWDPAEQPRLHTWLGARLAEGYPSLRAFSSTTAQALAGQGHLLPILDGLDELPAHRRPGVIAALNSSFTHTDQLVLTSRTTEYTTAVTEAGDVLTSAAVIAPELLTAAQAADYLTHCLPPDSGPVWRELLHRLRTGTAEHLAPVLITPLGLWLLRTVYIEPRADPTPLLTPGPTPVHANLFDQLIPTMLTTRPASCHGDIFRPRRSWKPHEVRRWLTYLARRLHHTDTRDLCWWQLARYNHITPRAVSVAVGAMVGLAFGLAVAVTFGMISGPMAGVPGGLLLGLLLGLAFGSMFGPPAQRWLRDEPAYANLRFRHRFMLLTQRLVIGVAVGMTVGTVVGPTLCLAAHLIGALRVGLTGALRVGLSGGLIVGLSGGLVIGLITWVGIPSRSDWATGPQSTYRATRTLTLLQLCLGLLTIVTVVGSIGWLAGPLTGSRTFGLVDGLEIGSMTGLAAGLAGGLAARRAGKLVIRSGAWLCYILAIWRLAATGKLPLRLMGFLDDAHRLGLLHSVGPAYQFRHAQFQDHLIQTTDTQATADQTTPSHAATHPIER
jgi:hypothetical protein